MNLNLTVDPFVSKSPLRSESLVSVDVVELCLVLPGIPARSWSLPSKINSLSNSAVRLGENWPEIGESGGDAGRED